MTARKSKKGGANENPIYPLILVRGLLGFGIIGPRSDMEYFRGVVRHLEDNKEVLRRRAKVHVAEVDSSDTIPSRAIQLRDFVQKKIFDARRKKFLHEKVHIIAHGVGGLDARYMISNLSMDTGDRSPMADHVATLTTIGTPHLGTPWADYLTELPVGQRLIQRTHLYRISLKAFEQLTFEFLVKEGFNDRMPDQEQVQYFSYAGSVLAFKVFPPLYPGAEIIRRTRNGDGNDGVVPVESAVFRYPPIDDRYAQVLPADHATQIGHGYATFPFGLGSFKHLEFYGHVANALAAGQ